VWNRLHIFTIAQLWEYYAIIDGFVNHPLMALIEAGNSTASSLVMRDNGIGYGKYSE